MRYHGLLSVLSTCALLPLLGVGAAGCSEKDPVESTIAGCEDFEHGGPGRCEGTCRVVNEEFCVHREVTPNCANIPAGAKNDVCGAVIQPPPKENDQVVELRLSPNVKEYAGSGPPNLSCYYPDGFPAPPDTAGSQLITMTGIAKIFSQGCESDALDISVYTVNRSGGANDGAPDQLVGSVVTTVDDCSIEGEPEADIEGCGTDDVRWECRYSYPDVPTETELVIVTEGADWAPIYEYGLFIRNSEVSNGEFEKDVRALANDDYQTIPQTAIGASITPGNGAVAGEVHDCDNLRVINAVVDINVSRAGLTYFSDDEDRPLPHLGAKATSALGLYAALDVRPGPVAVGAAGVLDGQLVGLGFMRVQAHPDAVTSVTFRGLKPHQVP